MYRQDLEDSHTVLNASQWVAGDKYSAPKRSPLALAAKRAIDIFGVLVFVTLFLPVYLAVALGVRLSSRGPVHYFQDRVGRDGKLFRFYKFRSMVPNSEEILTSFLHSDPQAKSQWDTHQKLERDPRITPFGRFIRRTSLDELPQMWNVLMGDMSLVGPRPCMPGQEKYYGKYWRTYCAVNPGLTGLWQGSGRSKLSFEDRVRLEARYVREWTLLGDFKILLKTVKVVLWADGSH